MRRVTWFTIYEVTLTVIWRIGSTQFSSVTQSCPTATPWTVARQASLSITNSRSSSRPMSIESVMPTNHLILCHHLLLPPSLFPSFGVFSNESALRIFLGGSDGKVSPWNLEDLGSIPGSGRSPGEGNGNPLQYSCLESSMDWGAERLHFLSFFLSFFASGGQSIGFSFNISPPNEYSGLISFRMDWLHLLAVQGTLKSLLQHHISQKHQFFGTQLSL